MKRFLLLLNLLVAACRFSQPATVYIGKPQAVSYSKDVRLVPGQASNEYNAFHTAFQSASDRITVIYRKGISETVNGSPSYAHLYRGRTQQRHYYPANDTWSTEEQIDIEAIRDLSDCMAGGQMDNGEFIYFSSISPVAIAYLSDGEPWPAGNFLPFFRKGTNSGSTIAWGSRTTLTGYDTSIRSGTVFGELQKGDNPGEYYVGMVMFGYGSETARKLYCVKTDDYFATWTYYEIYSGPTIPSEIGLVYMGTGRMMAFVRADNGNCFTIFKSSDSGVTWTATGGNDVANNLGWSCFQAKIPSAIFMNKGLLQIMYHDRDSYFTAISKDNDPDDFFASSTPVFNDPELYWHAYTAGASNPSLGYPKLVPFDSNYFFIAALEVNDLEANLYYTMDNLVTDDTAPVAPPIITASFQTTTTFRLDITGYTNAQLQKIRYFQIDVSTASDFSTFVTASYNKVAAIVNPAGVIMQNRRMTALWIGLAVLNTRTTYYYRIRAVNNAGNSSYTGGNTTTL